MKIPYIKIPITDMAAYLAPCSAQAKGQILEAVLAFGMYQTWPELALDAAQQQAYQIVQKLIEREIKSYKKFCKEQKSKIQKYWAQTKNADDTTVLPARNNQTKQEQKQKQEQENNRTPIPPTGQGVQTSAFVCSNPTQDPKQQRLLEFAEQVRLHYEAAVKTPEQSRIWLRQNRRHLRDIFEFCGRDTTLALRTIEKCVLRLKQAGLAGSYGAVCRNLPDYFAQAKAELEEEYGYTK